MKQIKGNVKFIWEQKNYTFNDVFLLSNEVPVLCNFDQNKSFSLGAKVDVQIVTNYEFKTFHPEAFFVEEISPDEHVWSLTLKFKDLHEEKIFNSLFQKYGLPVHFYQKRKFPRIPKIGVQSAFPKNTLFFSTRDHIQTESECILNDISIGGLKVTVTNSRFLELDVNQILKFTIKNVSQVQDIHFKGRIVRIKKIVDENENIYLELGVRFVDLSDIDQKVLLKMIEVIVMNIKKQSA